MGVAEEGVRLGGICAGEELSVIRSVTSHSCIFRLEKSDS